MMDSILSGLNPQQKKAVTTASGPILIIAGAGSGKTKTLTHRIAYLIGEKKIRPSNILAVTFTNKAAGEMKTRVAKLLGIHDSRYRTRNPALPVIGTFHSICVQILRMEIEKLGYKKSFNIFDDHDQLVLMKKIVKQLEINPDQFNPKGFIETISRAKSDLKEEKQFRQEISGYYEEITAKVYEAYQEKLRESNALDFDDLISLTVKLFEKFPKVLEKYQLQFKYVLVDEYQDTNRAQYVLVNLLAQKHRNLCVVGDDWQSIYGWRQADIRNILNFEKDYPEAKVITLEQNYRSTQIILDAAYGIISKNIHRKDKKLWTEKQEGYLVSSYEAEDETDEAEYIARTIKAEIKKSGGLNYSDLVVLYRTNAQSRIIEEVFLKHSLPYRIVGGIKFYQRKEIKDIVAYLRLIQNHNDAVALDRIIEQHKGIGEKTLNSWISCAKKNSLNLVETGMRFSKLCPAAANSKSDLIAQFCEFIKRMAEIRNRIILSDFIEKLLKESGYEKNLLDSTLEGEMRWENVRELITVAQKYEDGKSNITLPIFLEEVALATDTDSIDQSQDAVHVMTLHSAKGLEFNTVFIAGLEEGILPHARSILSAPEMEEERRLMYVGVTRAKEKVYLLFTKQRNIFGSTQINLPSRFLDDIPEHLLQDAQLQTSNFKLQTFNKKSDFVENKKPPINFKDGERVKHSEFGEGVVISTQGDIITVAFRKAGIKKLSLSFAFLKKL